MASTRMHDFFTSWPTNFSVGIRTRNSYIKWLDQNLWRREISEKLEPPPDDLHLLWKDIDSLSRLISLSLLMNYGISIPCRLHVNLILKVTLSNISAKTSESGPEWAQSLYSCFNQITTYLMPTATDSRVGAGIRPWSSSVDSFRRNSTRCGWPLMSKENVGSSSTC